MPSPPAALAQAGHTHTHTREPGSCCSARRECRCIGRWVPPRIGPRQLGPRAFGDVASPLRALTGQRRFPAGCGNARTSPALAVVRSVQVF